MKVSNCCEASPKTNYQQEVSICSKCGEHCQYEETEIKVRLMTKEEKKKWDKELAKEEAEWTRQYDNCYCEEW